MKKILRFIIIMMFLGGLFTIPVSATGNIKILFNGEELEFDLSPQFIDGKMMIPIRKIFETLGARIEWDDKNQIISLFPSDGGKIVLQVGNKIVAFDVAGKNQKFIEFDSAPLILNDHTFISIEMLSAYKDVNVKWNEKTKTVIIITK